MKQLLQFFKKCYFIFLTIFFTISLTSCKKIETNYLSDPIAIVYKNNIPYLINLKGETFSLEQYDTIVPYYDDIIIVKKNNLFGYIKNTGEKITEVIYNEAYPFSENKAVVSLNDKFSIIDTSGKTLYEFPETITSNSYFSNNSLVIEKENKQGYLIYNNENQEFNYLFLKESKNNSTEDNYDKIFAYDYCGHFENGFAVVANLNENNELKYTHIDSSGSRLYDYEWDYANNFSEGYAVVGNKIDYTVQIYCGNTYTFDTTQTTTANIIGYMYISPTGEYLTSESSNIPYVFASANDFKNGVAITSNLYFYVDKANQKYDFSTKRYFYNYNFIYTDGSSIFNDEYIMLENNWGGSLCIYKDILKLDNYYIFNYFNAYWKILSTDITNFDKNNPLQIIEYDLTKYKDNTELVNNFPWVDEYLKNYTYGITSAYYVVDHVTIPYNMSSFSNSKFLNNAFVAKAQVYSGFADTCGLITINIIDNELKLSYVIPPLYDEIIY